MFELLIESATSLLIALNILKFFKFIMPLLILHVSKNNLFLYIVTEPCNRISFFLTTTASKNLLVNHSRHTGQRGMYPKIKCFMRT